MSKLKPEKIIVSKSKDVLKLIYRSKREVTLTAEYLRVFSPSAEVRGHRSSDYILQVGKKNVVIVGCSHTFGQGLDDNEHWVAHLSKHNTQRLRYWNLGVPGASGDSCVRTLWGTQKLIDPRIVIVCWQDESRRELSEPKHNTSDYDVQILLRNIYFT